MSVIDPAVYVGFLCWFGALLLILLSLIPRKYTVDRSLIKRDPNDTTGPLGIEDFFFQTARYKRRLLIASSVLFFIGVACAAWAVV